MFPRFTPLEYQRLVAGFRRTESEADLLGRDVWRNT